MFIADILRSPRLTSARNIYRFFIIKPFGITDCVSRVIYTACIRFWIPSLSPGWVRHKCLNSCALAALLPPHKWRLRNRLISYFPFKSANRLQDSKDIGSILSMGLASFPVEFAFPWIEMQYQNYLIILYRKLIK